MSVCVGVWGVLECGCMGVCVRRSVCVWVCVRVCVYICVEMCVWGEEGDVCVFLFISKHHLLPNYIGHMDSPLL